MSEFVVITGLSGAGRSSVAKDFEDLGWFVIDNLPTELIPKVVELVEAPGSVISRVALVTGSGAGPDELPPALRQMRSSGARVRMLFLDAASEGLVRRYESTRRRHPQLDGGEGLTDAIERERSMLEPVKAVADVVIDTTDLNVHELRQRIVSLFGAEAADAGMQTSIVSFGYKHGLPLDVDLVLDCRFLPNPHWEEELRPLTGRDEPVRRYVLDQGPAKEFLDRVDGLLAFLLPAYVNEGKSYLSVAFGCTGGRHRSVAIAEEVAQRLGAHGVNPTVIHRDVAK
jgi:RNase adapter protein RapZ